MQTLSTSWMDSSIFYFGIRNRTICTNNPFCQFFLWLWLDCSFFFPKFNNPIMAKATNMAFEWFIESNINRLTVACTSSRNVLNFSMQFPNHINNIMQHMTANYLSMMLQSIQAFSYHTYIGPSWSVCNSFLQCNNFHFLNNQKQWQPVSWWNNWFNCSLFDSSADEKNINYFSFECKFLGCIEKYTGVWSILIIHLHSTRGKQIKLMIVKSWHVKT